MQRRESLTDDEKIGSTAGMTTLLESMRGHQNEALAQDVYYDASQMQQAIMTVLNASSGSRSTGMSMPVVTSIQGVFQRLHRYARNRGCEFKADFYQRYVSDLNGIMQGNYL